MIALFCVYECHAWCRMDSALTILSASAFMAFTSLTTSFFTASSFVRRVCRQTQAYTHTYTHRPHTHTHSVNTQQQNSLKVTNANKQPASLAQPSMGCTVTNVQCNGYSVTIHTVASTLHICILWTTHVIWGFLRLLTYISCCLLTMAMRFQSWQRLEDELQTRVFMTTNFSLC